ncbi:MAG TPA: ligand-gated channel [Alphaproteobacteria bacterium]|nr:ligand-gated channel [Alphaproteobacteria bacterium]
MPRVWRRMVMANKSVFVRHAAMLCFSVSIWPAVAYADQDNESEGENLGPVVVSATRTETPASELTQSVTVVTRDELEKQSRISRNVGAILGKTVPGFSPSTEALTDFGQTLRGRNFLTLIDGVPQSTPLRDGRRSLNTIDSGAIEQIEVVRGGTAVYGFGATGGLINMISRRPEDGAFNGRAEVGVKFSTTEVDDSEELHGSIQASGRRDAFDYLVNATYVQRNGFFDADGDRIPADPFGVQGGLADTDEYNILAKLGYEPEGKDQRLGVTINRFEIQQDSDFAGIGVGNPALRIKTPATRGGINVAKPGTENSLVNLDYSNGSIMGSSVKAQLYYGDLTTRFSKFPGFSQVEINSEKRGARLTIDTPVTIGQMSFNAVWGLDYLNDKTKQPALDGPDTTPRLDQDAYAGFLQLEVPVGDRLMLRGGARYEDISVDVDDVVNDNAIFVRGGTLDFDELLLNGSAILFVTDSIELFGGASQGFSLADLGRSIASTLATNVSVLQSEVQTVDNYELGVRVMRPGWDASLAGFLSESDNGTTFNQALVIVKQPERIHGLELSANATPWARTKFGGSFAWLDGEVDLNGDGDYEEDLPTTRIPPVKISGYADYSPRENIVTRLQGLYSGERNPVSTQFGNGEVDSYVIFDFYASVTTRFGIFDLGVQNLLNKDYFPVLSQAGALPFGYSTGPGRTVSLTYGIRW